MQVNSLKHTFPNAKDIILLGLSFCWQSEPLLAGESATLPLFISTRYESIEAADKAPLEQYLRAENCLASITHGDPHPEARSGLVFRVMTTAQAKSDPPTVLGHTKRDIPLYTAWLVPASNSIQRLSEFSGPRVSLLAAPSLLGYTVPVKQLNAAGLNIENFTVYTTQQYDGAMALLLHGDVNASSIPSPLAIPWAEANNLRIIDRSPDDYQSGIWPITAFSDQPTCITALSKLTRESIRDKRLKLFPEWLQGFSLNK